MTSFKRNLFFALITILMTGVTGSLLLAQDSVPTLVPPTLVPTNPPPDLDALPDESALARIRDSGVVRVGILFNEPPYGELDIRGQVTGYDAAVVRALAEVWGVEVEFVQVTRQNRIDLLRQGHVDLLAAAQVHYRELDSLVEFSQTYRLGQQSMMVRADDPAETLFNLANRRIGYALRTPGEAALQDWQQRSGLPVEQQGFASLDQAYRALIAGEVDGIVARRNHLLRVSGAFQESVKLLEEPVQYEPFAIVVPRQDVPLRNLVNHTLQYLLDRESLVELHSEYFPGEQFAFDALPVWENIQDEEPLTPGTVGTGITYPQQYTVPRVLSQQVVRVGGVGNPEAADTPSEQRLAGFQRALVTEMASRWGVQVQFVDGDPLALLEAGEIDLAAGLQADWDLADRFDFSQPYLLRGDRLMVPTRRNITSFRELRNETVGVMLSDEGAGERAEGWASSINSRIQLFRTREQDAALAILEDLNADVIFGDSLKLVQHLEAYPDDLNLTERWYSRNYQVFALPRNDLDFRLLVNYTLQELFSDGTLQSLMAPVYPPGEDLPAFDVWPGSSEYLGLNLGS